MLLLASSILLTYLLATLLKPSITTIITTNNTIHTPWTIFAFALFDAGGGRKQPSNKKNQSSVLDIIERGSNYTTL
jgi:hypothetical protein